MRVSVINARTTSKAVEPNKMTDMDGVSNACIMVSTGKKKRTQHAARGITKYLGGSRAATICRSPRVMARSPIVLQYRG
jgi:hypothetical protein